MPPVAFTMANLLDWRNWALVLDGRGHPEDSATWPSGAPSLNATALELPEGLVLSPDDQSRFLGRTSPLTHGNVTEEWVARLQHGTSPTGLTEPSVTAPLSVRAIWTTGYVEAPAALTSPAEPFVRPLTSGDRKQLVRAMGDPRDLTAYPNHEPARARRLWLGATGGWVDAEASWTGGTGAVTAWRHRAVTGRDSAVTIVYRGYLAPFGVPASVAVVSDRVFGTDSTGARVAQLLRKELLVVGETPVTTPRPFAPVGDRRSLFTSVTGTGTYEMVRRQINSGGAISTVDAFVPEDSSGDEIQVAFTAVDRTGRRIGFTSPVVFVSYAKAFDAGPGDVPARVVDHLRSGGTKSWRQVDMSDQQLAFADEVTAGDGSTTMRALDVTFDARGPQNGTTATQLRNAGQPAFFPSMEEATVRDDGAEAVAGEPGAAFGVELSTGWLTEGNGPGNFGLTFLSIPSPAGVDFGGDLGGLVTPDLSTGQIGQAIGRSVSLPSAGSVWDPATALQDSAKLLGSISLKWLLDAFEVAADLAGDLRLPRFDVDLDFSLPGVPSEPCQSFDWQPPIKSVVVGGTRILCIRDDLAGEHLDDPFGAPSALTFHVEQCVSLDPATAGEVHDTVELSLTNVVLQFPPAVPMLAVYIDRLRYLDLPDAPPDVDVEINGIQLVGPLNFLDALVDLLPDSLAGFAVDVLDSAIDVDLDLKLPSLNLGVFSLTDLHLGLGVSIPLGDDATTTRFSLGSRENPFSLSILGIGGSGSIEIEAAPHPVGLVRVEVSLGVLLELSIDVVVARGSISAAFSLGLEVEKVNALNPATGQQELVDRTTLTAALDCVGEVEVLGLITITIEFLLALEYVVQDRLLTGEVSVTVEVDAAIVKKEVRFSVQQQFALGDDPAPRRALAGRSIGDKLDFSSRYAADTDWADYCGAFA